ncbi:hypothetical protein FOA43_003588 [Brettanomyces nanus]|uniref:Protoporphyrinogen oxidase n=1 Tax=Eeniella nana TaxID=13502 RepID=A0A875S8H7_EENNA|nr:uncharacterized protein FOA43_003588 [Brettanomyces nanus]QPG76202.1 hypothetical protein FOA43_003588 [Brettanomyces nanus]
MAPDWKITVFEANDKTGGYIRSQPTKVADSSSTVFEKGPRTLRGVSEGTLILLDLVAKFGKQQSILGVHKEAAANKKYLLSPSKARQLVQVPDDFTSLRKFLTNSIGRSIPMALGKEFFTLRRGHGEETVEQFFNRHYGKGLSDNLISAIFHGVYAADAGKLSINAVMPSMVKLESKSASIGRYTVWKALFNSKKSQESAPPIKLSANLRKYQDLFSPKLNLLNMSEFLKSFPMTLLQGGLETLPQCIANNLPKNVEVVYNSKISSIKPLASGQVALTFEDGNTERFDHLRSTINTRALSSLIDSKPMKDVFSQVNYSSVSLANVYIPKKNILPVSGFGFLVPKASTDKAKLLGVIFDSDVEHSARPLFSLESVRKELTSKTVSTPDKLKQLAEDVFHSQPLNTRPYTKVTFMLGGHMYDGIKTFPKEHEIKKIVEDTFGSILHTPLSDYQLEVGLIENAIPQYNVGYLDLKAQAWKLADSEFHGALSFGGMTFADGVGVPDCVMSSFKDAVKLAHL